ncbi:MAG: phosphoribosylformylglycinamidine synthase, partial [Bacteroidales bacterium]|nr:phosphoribosylformylglycinamidine synthase [Bacteroidales bacterium]
NFIAVESLKKFTDESVQKLEWLFSGAKLKKETDIQGFFIGPRKEMITPWSTNAVEITQNMGLNGISRIEEFDRAENIDIDFDPMLKARYNNLNQHIFTIDIKPEPVKEIDNIDAYNKSEGLALSDEEIEYLNKVAKARGRKLTDSEVFGFSQVNSEHCRHKIFNGTFVINGQTMSESLFQLIKKTTKENPNKVVSAYKDNVAFIEGPVSEQFAPKTQDKPDEFEVTDIDTILSLKAETHNFPTTVEPFNGAATGSGGEIRDRMAGGKGSVPLAGTAVYITSYPRLNGARPWEKAIMERKWLYQTPEQILIKASNGASDFGNKFGQPLICGSLLTFEHEENNTKYGFDKVIMLAGGVGFAKQQDAKKDQPEVGDRIIVMGGDNYRIGMGGGAVSSVATGEYHSSIELNAVQRSNPEMQKRVYNAIRAMSESNENKIISIHDHGAGGHLNCLSELVEATGGKINMDKLPIGDPTLSAKEIIGNESQERMGLVLKDVDVPLMQKIADRERAPFYNVGEITGDMQFKFENKNGETPIDIKLEYLFGNPPKTIIEDKAVTVAFDEITYDSSKLFEYLEQVLQLESVACKDWLTNKVDRSVTGKIAKQQTAGPLQLPLNNLGVMAIDYQGICGIATAIGHAPVSGLINPESGSVLSVVEALTNIIWAPLTHELKVVSLSANWMWPCKNEGEDARLYKAVKAISDFCIELGINIPTGKDSLSMTQKYPDGNIVISPGTVIISAAAEVDDIRKVVEPVIRPIENSKLLYIPFSKAELSLGGSSFAQILNKIGNEPPQIDDAKYIVKVFNAVQKLIKQNSIIAGHDVSAGGLITTLLEMLFADNITGALVNFDCFNETDIIKILFCENPAIVIQVNDNEVEELLNSERISYIELGKIINDRKLDVTLNNKSFNFDINKLRDSWFKTSYLLDRKQSGEKQALERFKSYKNNTIDYQFTPEFSGRFSQYNIDPKRRTKTGIKAAIIREKGVNGDREMAYMLYLAGFDVKDVHMTDLIAGRETLEDISFIVFVGGFSNSDVLGSAKGWAGAFLYNEKAKTALENFYKRTDTLSLGVCNGCQLMVELNLVYPEHENRPKMALNVSHKFESPFLGVTVQKNNSVLLGSLLGSKLGIWIAHGEGRFELPYPESEYLIPLKFARSAYPANPNGSDYDVAAIVSKDGRHLAMMPHLERAFFPWQCGYYPDSRKKDDVTPWIEAFVNAREWVKKHKK